jgi:hypothetical protein
MERRPSEGPVALRIGSSAAKRVVTLAIEDTKQALAAENGTSSPKAA